MKYWLLAASVALALASIPVSPQEQPPQPLSMSLDCSGSDCPLLLGTPQTTGMRSGFVHLKPGESVGWHSTKEQEEALVILHGQGKAEVEGRDPVAFSSRMLVYIPPRSRHNVSNTGKELLEYVYVVSPVAGGAR
jgi:quercetin dioxygenase-like cupin family protein